MVGLVTWPTYGTWFGGHGRGWVDRGRTFSGVPEPTRRGRSRRWPPVRLDEGQRQVIVDDVDRIARLRGFELIMAAVAASHVHLLLACEPDRDVPRLVQLIKGALSRALTVAVGNEPARSDGGDVLAHRKWWTRQYSFVPISDRDALGRVVDALEAHREIGASCYRNRQAEISL